MIISGNPNNPLGYYYYNFNMRNGVTFTTYVLLVQVGIFDTTHLHGYVCMHVYTYTTADIDLHRCSHACIQVQQWCVNILICKCERTYTSVYTAPCKHTTYMTTCSLRCDTCTYVYDLPNNPKAHMLARGGHSESDYSHMTGV